MPKLPQIKAKILIKFFQKQGFRITRQVGSHVRLAHADDRKLTIAVHNKPIAVGTLNAILKQAQMSQDEFLSLFKS